jgi:hypothetical protein
MAYRVVFEKGLAALFGVDTIPFLPPLHHMKRVAAQVDVCKNALSGVFIMSS